MAIFGKNKQDEFHVNVISDLNNKRDDKERDALIEQIEKVQEVIKDIEGCKGIFENNDFGNRMSYKFHIENEAYVFDASMLIGDYKYMTIEDLKQIIENQTIRFPFSEYDCQLCDKPLVEQVGENGEMLITIQNIAVSFIHKTSKETQVFLFDNNPSNIAPHATFFQKLGVKNYYNAINIPDEIFDLTVQDGSGFMGKGKYVVFRDHGNLMMLRRKIKTLGGKTEVSIRSIPVQDILYYKQEGSLRYEQMISGGGGNETSYGGAIVGGLLFGAAGAIIGSRKNEEKISVTSTTVAKDTRIVVLAFKRDSFVYQVACDQTADNVFDWIIPEKQYDYVISKRRAYYESIKNK